ncbi:hypothetical protein PRZ48_006738 [Zasmidium cellare]|uniref:Peptidase S53 domain-containing protein n=1 Tax=Zasmidium cellare TaxID=395010 RepID=A0ABR0EQ76_ZASCE|nr:hypothetical protein PRZ48_006738 [Zasmidium cellare]
MGHAYSVPDNLADDIDLIAPTTYFGDLQPHSVIPEKITMENLEEQNKRDELEQHTKRDNLQPSCLTTYVSKRTNRTYEAITPQCLKQLYNTVDYKPDPKSGSNIAFANFLKESPSYSDLHLFEKEFNLPQQDFDILALINGGVNDQNPQTETDGEANLDVQNIIGLVDGLPVYTYITGGMGPLVPDLLSPNMSADTNEPYLEYFSYLLSQPNSKLPHVLSQSYGDHENTVPETYAKRICNQIGMLGLRGRSVLFSTGDEGTGAVCRDNSPPGNLYGHPEFTPQFPTTCPYVTAVGGTQAYNPEVAWNASGSGFSRYFPTAFYQKDAVNKYLSTYINPEAKAYYEAGNFTDFKGRGVPDVAAHSLYPYYLIYVNGSRALSGGTSAAVPVFSSIVALLNDARFRAGKPALGFLNPWLYSSASAIDDITEGAAVGCNGVDLQNGNPVPGGGIIPYASWNATVAWDPVTGLGTPDFQKLKASALAGCPGKNGGGWHLGWHGGNGW